jgi:hypothetical protein
MTIGLKEIGTLQALMPDSSVTELRVLETRNSGFWVLNGYYDEAYYSYVLQQKSSNGADVLAQPVQLGSGQYSQLQLMKNGSALVTIYDHTTSRMKLKIVDANGHLTTLKFQPKVLEYGKTEVIELRNSKLFAIWQADFGFKYQLLNRDGSSASSIFTIKDAGVFSAELW